MINFLKQLNLLKITLGILLFFLFTNTIAQNYIVSGIIKGGHDNLAFATIYLKGTTKGVNSNDAGNYSLKLEKGLHTLVFKYIGYSKQEIEINLTENKILNVNLIAEGVLLQEVTIKSGEDPSYAIIRKAIKKRKFYFNEVKEYSCQSYIKGLQRLNHVPEKIKKLIKFTTGEKIDSTQLGVIYLSESESNYFFQKPNKEKEIMFSSKISGENKNFSFNQLSQLKFNFYDNLVTIKGISDRPIISPLNKNAFLYYKFYLVGTIIEDGKIINKIKIKPKRNTDPCFTGIIYIQDKTWRLTSLDLNLTKENKINFVDTLSIKQIQAPILNDSIWMPVNHNLSFSFNFMGIKGSGYFNATVRNYNLYPNFNKKTFSNEKLLIEDGANKKDSNYWNLNRLAPLTKEENRDYLKKDSVSKIEDSEKYKDSIDKKRNRMRLANILIGYKYNKTKNGLSISVPGIIKNGIQYNTIEGINLNCYFSINKQFEDYRSHSINGRIRYGLSNSLLGGEIGYNYFYNPKKNSRVGFKFQSIVEQFNSSDPINPLVNSLYTLFKNDNYMKLYKETAIESSYFNEVINGVFFNSVIKYAQRDLLINSSDLLIIDDKIKLFTSNIPNASITSDSVYFNSNAFTAEATISIRFKQKYISMPNKKIITGSKYPRISITYKKAIPVFFSKINYDLASAMIYDEVNLSLLGKIAYRIKVGGFLNTKKIAFMDFKHFLGNQTILNTNEYLGSYRLLPYYEFSADRWYIESHIEHHFNGFLVNKIPLIKKLRLQEVIGGHLLMNNRLSKYYEINFGIENILNALRIDYVLSYGINNEVNSGFTIGVISRL